MFHKVKKYIIGFFVLCGGILFAFLSGKSAGRKQLSREIKPKRLQSKGLQSKGLQSKGLQSTELSRMLISGAV